MQQRPGQRACLTAALVLFITSTAGSLGVQEGAALGPLDFTGAELPLDLQSPPVPEVGPSSALMTVPLPQDVPSENIPVTEGTSEPAPSANDAESAVVAATGQDAAPVASRWSDVRLPEAGAATAGGDLLPSGEGAGEAFQVERQVKHAKAHRGIEPGNMALIDRATGARWAAWMAFSIRKDRRL
ncbi:MAG: hypothetical protein MK082_12430, partial [Phycisphaerales bacterium]|nr:hypothetical protein [Phycisphaerales bacterium]